MNPSTLVAVRSRSTLRDRYTYPKLLVEYIPQRNINLKLTIMKKLTLILTLLVICVTTFYSCSYLDKPKQETMHEEMITLMNNLRDAAIDLDAEKIIDMCLDSPEFLFFSDGELLNYEQFVSVERTEFPNFISMELSWDTLYVKVLSPDVVSALAPFHQKIAHKDGTVFQYEGEVTWIAVHTEEGLKLIYGHAAHRPDTASN